MSNSLAHRVGISRMLAPPAVLVPFLSMLKKVRTACAHPMSPASADSTVQNSVRASRGILSSSFFPRRSESTLLFRRIGRGRSTGSGERKEPKPGLLGVMSPMVATLGLEGMVPIMAAGPRPIFGDAADGVLRRYCSALV